VWQLVRVCSRVMSRMGLNRGASMVWEYKNLQLRTSPEFGVWSRISESNLNRLSSLQSDGWHVYQVVNIRGSFGFTAHVLFMLRRELAN